MEKQLTSKQERFLLALMEANTIKEAYEEVGISHETANTWLKLSHIQQKYIEMRKEKMRDAILSFTQDISLARATLRKHCTDENTSAYVQVLAAKSIMECGVDIFKHFEVVEKLLKFEELLKEKGFL